MTDKYRRFIAARDFLQLHRNDYDTAYRDYRAPVLPEFNWALDFFDVQAKGNTAPALWVVDENGKESKISFADMAQRSSQVANYLRSLGVKRGERLLLMLPNRVELWEIMLACIKLGAVIVPTTMLVSGDDLLDRMERGAIRHVVAQTTELENLPRSATVSRASPSAAPRPAGTRLKKAALPPPAFHRMRARWRPIPCCCISPRAPPPNPSWCCTVIPATPSATCPPCIGSA